MQKPGRASPSSKMYLLPGAKKLENWKKKKKNETLGCSRGGGGGERIEKARQNVSCLNNSDFCSGVL